jgi:glutamine synthetase
MTSGRLTRDELKEAVSRGEIDTVIVALADVQGRLMGKRVDATYFLDELGDGVIEGCAYLLATDVEMRTVDGYALTSWDRGYGDLALRSDFASIRRVPWHEKTAIVFADAEGSDGQAVAVSPRQVLRHQVDRLSARGWTALVGTELEFMVFDDSYATAWSAGYRDLLPANRFNVDYSLQGSAEVEALLGRVRRGMRGAGMVVESSKGECNRGQHEIGFKYLEPVDKCDEHSLFKLGAKEIAAQVGRSLTFMAKFDEREGNSCHVHLSLRDQGGHPVFAGEGPHGLSPIFGSFLAGLITHARELSLLFAPNINSYKRFAAGSFAPTALVWGFDNRTCAFRVVGHGPSLRVECRIPGGDANPYLTCAGLIAAGLAGVDGGLALAPPLTTSGYSSDAPRVPSSLVDARELFFTSALARSAFGDDVVDHYAHAAKVEIDAFGAAVTDWERVRGFERL